MEALIVVGAALSLAGLAGLVWCIVAALKIRRSTEDEATLRARLQRIAIGNMAALGLSILGLMAVVIGVLLG